MGTEVVLGLCYHEDELYDRRKQRTCMLSILQMADLSLMCGYYRNIWANIRPTLGRPSKYSIKYNSLLCVPREYDFGTLPRTHNQLLHEVIIANNHKVFFYILYSRYDYSLQ